MGNIIQDVITEISGNWDSGVTSAPEFLNGVRETNKKGRRNTYKNVIFIYNMNNKYDLLDPNHIYRDIDYLVRLDIETSQSENKRDDIVSECTRIIGQTGITNYDNRNIINERSYGNSSKWSSQITIKLTNYNKLI